MKVSTWVESFCCFLLFSAFESDVAANLADGVGMDVQALGPLGTLSTSGTQERGVIDHELALEREPRDVRLIVTEAVRHILETSLGDEGQPPRRVALALQLVALAVKARLALPLAEFPQRLEV